MGYEPVTIADIRGYKPETNSIGSGQVLHCPYDFEKTKLIVREMTDALVLDLVEKQLVTDQIVLDIGYDIENLTKPGHPEKVSWRGKSRPIWKIRSEACPRNSKSGYKNIFYSKNHGRRFRFI